MRLNNFKYFLLLILLGCLLHLKMQGMGLFNPVSKGVRFYFSEAKNLAQDNQDEEPSFKRKYKSKGLQVIAPLLTNLTFKIFRLSSPVSFVIQSEVCSSFLYCARYKRGPPALNG